MFGILNSLLRTSTRTEKWNPPDHWQGHVNQSAYHRQHTRAEAHRRRLERDVGLF